MYSSLILIVPFLGLAACVARPDTSATSIESITPVSGVTVPADFSSVVYEVSIALAEQFPSLTTSLASSQVVQIANDYLQLWNTFSNTLEQFANPALETFTEDNQLLQLIPTDIPLSQQQDIANLLLNIPFPTQTLPDYIASVLSGVPSSQSYILSLEISAGGSYYAPWWAEISSFVTKDLGLGSSSVVTTAAPGNDVSTSVAATITAMPSSIESLPTAPTKSSTAAAQSSAAGHLQKTAVIVGAFVLAVIAFL